MGIVAQSMLLQAVEIGLNGICIGAFDRKAVQQALSLELEPLLILAIGRGIDNIRLVEISTTDNHNYYRHDGVHYVPKIGVKNLILNKKA
jgi:nitroreductase